MRDDLDGAPQIVTLALPTDDVVVDGARSNIGVARETLVDEPLVVTEVQVGLGPVVGDKHLAMLVGAHGARIDVQVGVELLDGHTEAAALEETPK
jgi:hypothetical protein